MMEVIECEQGSPDWFKARAGVPTASEFATILAKGRSGADSRTRRTYMFKLAGERITGEPMQSYTNGHMERGKEMEDEARQLYALMKDGDPRQVGFMLDRLKGAGCSPDSLLGEEGLLEVKTCLPHILIDHLLKDEFPPEHRAQTQGQLWISGREWIDIIVYWPGIRPLIKRAYREPTYIVDLADAIDKFNEELEAVIDRIGKAA